MAIYPNPATDELFINMKNETKSMIVEIYNTDGKKVFDKKVVSSFTKVDVSELQSGIYFVNILKDDGTKVNKKVFIK